MSQCAKCFKEKHCKLNNNKHLKDCPTLNTDYTKASQDYYDSGSRDFLLKSLEQVASGYKNGKPCKTRLEEIIEFCHRMNYKKLGLAFCTALEDEARILSRILEKEGFEVVSAICKVGGIKKEDVGLDDSDKITPGNREITCNPAEQAIILNEAKTEFNIVVGLCVGHDSIFLKASDAYCSVFVVKDRVLKHNPIKALEKY